MTTTTVLVVDDEKNIRLTLTQALETLGVRVDAAVNGEEALQKLEQSPYALMLLDLKMPGMNGLEVLRRMREFHSGVRVIIITAYGTIESAVEAMKLGAVDFIQKPFTPKEIRELVQTVLQRGELPADATDYSTVIELCKRSINEGDFTAALLAARRAVSLNPASAEAFNLLGALLEIDGKMDEAIRFYRTAVSLDESYAPAMANLERTTTIGRDGAISLDDI